MGRPGAPTRVTLALQHPFGSGSLRVKVDDRVVVATSLQGMPVRRNGETTGYDGRLSTDFSVPPGRHTIQVEVRSGETALVQSVELRTAGGESRRLLGRANGTLTLAFQ